MTDTYQSEGQGDEIVDKEWIAHQLEKLIAGEVIARPCWSLDQAAQYMGVSKDTARRYLSQPGAPKPVRPQVNEETGKVGPARYVPAEIEAWYTSPANREALPAQRRRAGSRSAARRSAGAR